MMPFEQLGYLNKISVLLLIKKRNYNIWFISHKIQFTIKEEIDFLLTYW